MKVLIADDEAVSRRLLQNYLQKWGHDVTVAQDGAEAWRLFEAGGFPVVITDWEMPQMDGVELVRRIRAASASGPGYVYTILLTAKSQKEDLVEGMEAGGPIGPVSPSVLAQEMLPALADEYLVFVAGGIGRGEAMAGYLEMGAVGVQLGTRFACASESIAHPNFKKAFFRANARDAVASVQLDPRLPVIPVRALKNKGTEEFTAKQREVGLLLDQGSVDRGEAQLRIEQFWAGARRRAVIDGDVENGSLMAGQSVGMVSEEDPVAQIIDTLLAESEAALSRR